MNASYYGASSMEAIIDGFNAHSDEDGANVTCADCGGACELVKARLLSKTQGTFRCPKCNNTHSKIYQSCGGGMGKQIAELPQADREKFFKDAKELSTKEIKERLQMQLTKEMRRPMKKAGCL